ncbi:hypothetical protein J4232_05455 [Candidatus Woesearchaeota archaeon]|nr:hypothetical protein [Candidatus Woesearchaeota archaeon]
MQQNFQEFLQLIEQLRSENGCPYDKLKEELGDLLLNILLVAQIAKEKTR